MERRCENTACDRVLVRRPREAAYHWEKRRACSRSCAGVIGGHTATAKHKARQAASVAEADRFCGFSKCGKKLVRRYTEGAADFRGRRTCSRPCAAEYVRENGGPAFMSRQKSSKAPCSECFGLSHRRPADGCPRCGGKFREESAA
jgi:hypothetical protein